MAIGKNVKGITIEFNADTTKLGTAMKQVNAQAKGVDKQLKAVNKALKFNPGNTELLAQKQTLLKQKIGQTKDQLELLKQAQAKLDDDPAVDKTSQDYMELRREIIETESKLKHFEGELKKAENYKFEKLGKSIQDVGGKMKKVGDGMSKYVTLPIVGAGAASVKAWYEVDDALDTVAKKTGASGEALTDMQDRARNLAKTIPTDFATAGDAIGEVNTRFKVTGDDLEDLAGKFIKFADLNDTDVSSSIDQVQKAMDAFGVPVEEAGSMLDVLNKVGQDTGISMDTLSESLVTNAPQLQAMGMTANRAATFLGQLEMSGIDSAKVMTGLNKAIVNGAKEGKALPEVMDEIKGSIVGASTEAEAMTAASEIFGSKAGPAIATAARNGALDFDSLTSSLTDAEGSLEKTFNETLDPADEFQMSLNSLKDTGYEVGNSLFTMLAPALEKMSEFLRGLSEKWQGLSPEMQGTIIKIAGVVAAIGPLLTILGQMTIGVGALIKFFPTLLSVGPKLVGMFGKIGKAFTAMKTLLLGNPWILAAAAAIAAIILIVKNWDKIKAFFIALWAKVKEVFSAAWEAIKGGLLAAWEAIKGAAMAVFNGILAYYKFVFNLYKTIILTVWNAIKTAVLAIWNGIKKAAMAVWNGIKTVIINPIKAVWTWLTTTWNNIKIMLRKKMMEIQLGAKLAWNNIKNAITAPIKAVKTWLSNAWTAIRDRAKNGFQKVKDAITAPIQKAKDIIKGIIDKIKGFFDFDFKLPDIKLPHISVSPPGWNIGDIFDGVIPSLGIDWYAKGGIFRSPQIVGVGERGPEAVLPIEKLQEMLSAMADNIVNGMSTSMMMQAATQTGAGEITIPIYLYPSGPKMGEETVKTYDKYKKILG